MKRVHEASIDELVLKFLLVCLVRALPNAHRAWLVAHALVHDPELVGHQLNEPLIVRDKDDPLPKVAERERSGRRVQCAGCRV